MVRWCLCCKKSSGPTLRSLLTKVKDPSPRRNWQVWSTRSPASVVSGKVYIVETQRLLEMQVKEHRDACSKRYKEKSVIAEHQWDQQHQVEWEDIRSSLR